jgi:hypothetical protein
VIAITAASSIKRGPAVRDIGSFVSGKHGRPKRYVETNFYIYAPRSMKLCENPHINK